jgi:tripartite-type tricarboxylate transporter receptor subunit TctC
VRGTGNPTHIGFGGAEARHQTRDDLCAVHGRGRAVNALLGGHITSVYSDYTTVSAQLKAGTLRACGGSRSALRRLTRRADAA